MEKGEHAMLFMTIGSYEPGVRDQVVKRRIENGPMTQGVKTIGEWTHIGGGRVFRLVESDDLMALQTACFAWSDLCKFEIVPVMDTEELMKNIKKPAH
jgi:hypothetical protein